MSGKKLRRIWKDITAGYRAELQESGDVELRAKPRDPSLTEQLRARQGLHPADLMESYLDACKKAPDASEATKRKWKEALGL